MYLYMHVCLYPFIYVFCLYLCIYVCMHVCICVSWGKENGFLASQSSDVIRNFANQKGHVNLDH